jgi:hypothetical protein
MRVDQWTDEALHPFRSLITAAGIAAAGLLVASCGHAPSARDVPAGATFAANILADDTKLFTFSTHLPRPSIESERRLRAYESEQQAESRPRQRIDHGEISKRALQAMLQENGYCREGYVLHELYEDRADYVIRGECRDAATAADRARFSRK